MTDQDKEIIFIDDYFKKQNISQKSLEIKVISNLRILKKWFKNDKEINNYGYDIVFNLTDNNNFKINENLILLDKVYQKIENIYKKNIDIFEQKNKNLQNINKNIKKYSMEYINNQISENNKNITILNSKKVSKLKNSLIIIFSLGFYNKNNKIIKEIKKFKHANINYENILLNLKNCKLKNENIIKNNIKNKKVNEQKFNLIKNALDKSIFYCTKIQESNLKNDNFDYKSINEIKLENQISTNEYKQYSL